MTTEITSRREIPTPTPQHARSLSRQELEDHRARIASEVKIVLSAYFQPHESDETRAGQIAWWCDELEDWTIEQVVWALRKWNRDKPSTRPTPGHIVAICKEARGRKYAAQASPPKPEPERERMTPDRAKEILAEVGLSDRFKSKRKPDDTDTHKQAD